MNGGGIDMQDVIHRSISEPIRNDADLERRWSGPDRGLIWCWESGRMLSRGGSDVADSARRGELPPLVWSGGVAGGPKNAARATTSRKPDKYGSLNYLAMWQGLRGDDLVIDRSQEPQITCSRTGRTVAFTDDLSKFVPKDK